MRSANDAAGAIASKSAAANDAIAALRKFIQSAFKKCYFTWYDD